MDSALISREDILTAAGTIEPLPASVSRLMNIVATPDYDAGAIVDIVNHDPALAGDVLARANSVVSGSRTLIGDLRQATARIGANTVVEIALRRTMQGRLAAAVPAYGLGPNDLWRHAVTASVAGEVIRKAAKKPVAPMISTAGLVHDIGKLVIAKCLPAGLTDSLVTAAKTDAMDIAEAERDVLGIDHGEVGAVVVRAWGLPVSVQTALTQHHASATTDTFTHALILADHVAHAVQEIEDARKADTSEDTSAEDEDEITPIVPEGAAHATALGIAVTALPALVADTADLASEVVSGYDT